MDSIKALWKFFLSFFKKNWQIQDYPLSYKIQEGVPENSKYCIQVINWWILSGLGATKAQALESLKENYSSLVQLKGYAPRPGTIVPIEFGPTQVMDEYPEITDDFIIKILGFSQDDPLFISDESTLYDFSTQDNIQDYQKKIQETYDVDVSDLEDGKISKIIEKIAINSK